MSSQTISVCTIHFQVVLGVIYMQRYHTVENVYTYVCMYDLYGVPPTYLYIDHTVDRI